MDIGSGEGDISFVVFSVGCRDGPTIFGGFGLVIVRYFL
jgi:hypothetical protein